VRSEARRAKSGPADRVFIALGSNLGDSVALVREAMTRLAAFADAPLRCSSLWQTEPVDCPPGSPPFINAVVELEPRPGERPESLLARLQQLEQEFGRRPKRRLNEPRPLDLDLLAFGAERRHTPNLVLPHPRAHQRRFVLAPWAEIAPSFAIPGQSRTVAGLLAGLNEPGTARRIEDRGR
jgi:2-amino-4-hydroxy-6-hydroxymethyldihydropteridine diphosphokinase